MIENKINQDNNPEKEPEEGVEPELFTRNEDDITTEITSNLRLEKVKIKRGFVKKIIQKLKRRK